MQDRSNVARGPAEDLRSVPVRLLDLIDDVRVELAERLQDVAGNRIAVTSNALAGLIGSASPAVQVQLLELIAGLDAIAHEVREVAVLLRPRPAAQAVTVEAGALIATRSAGPARGAAGQDRGVGVMTTSPSPVPVSPSRAPLRLRLGSSAAGAHIDGAWWPQSRDLQTEAADLVDNFPATAGDIDRLLFSRPDWDNPAVDRHGLSRIPARRGPVKVGSFPSDDTHLMVLTMASGQRLRLLVIPCEVDADEGDRQLMSVGDHGAHDVEDSTWQRWDDEGPGS